MKRIFGKLLFILIASATWAGAGEGLFSAGLRMQGFVDFEPGNDYYEGPEIGYSNYYMAAHQLELKFCFLTNRLEHLGRPHITPKDYYLFTPEWHFSRNAFFDPMVQADFGWTHYDVPSIPGVPDGSFDNGTFKHPSWIGGVQMGFNFNLAEGAYGIGYHFGYDFILPKSGLDQPGVFGLSAWMML